MSSNLWLFGRILLRFALPNTITLAFLTDDDDNNKKKGQQQHDTKKCSVLSLILFLWILLFCFPLFWLVSKRKTRREREIEKERWNNVCKDKKYANDRQQIIHSNTMWRWKWQHTHTTKKRTKKNESQHSWDIFCNLLDHKILSGQVTKKTQFKIKKNNCHRFHCLKWDAVTTNPMMTIFPKYDEKLTK